MIAPPKLLANATMCKQFSDAHTSTFAQATAAQYLKAGRMPATLANVRKVYGERARVMGDALRRELGDAIEFVQPQGGLFVWARLTGAGGKVSNGNELAKRAIEQGVAFVPGAPFYASNPDLATLRLSFATADVGKIEEGVGRLGKAKGMLNSSCRFSTKCCAPIGKRHVIFSINLSKRRVPVFRELNFEQRLFRKVGELVVKSLFLES
jgi:2-aminoadipate transaminase